MVSFFTILQDFPKNKTVFAMYSPSSYSYEFSYRNVVKFYGIAASREPIMIALEFCPGGALDVRLERTKTTDFQKIRFLYHAALGITYLHEQDIVHGDIAARNCLLDANDLLKISDFGLSTDNEGSRMKGDKVTIRYMAPEAIEKKISIKANNSWAFSVLIFEVFHRGFGPSLS
ncbi:hypothetical protein L5515_009090 [Caenorhabditis briggsae]|uniref:Protein kinase domain-containing protein n=1 Tax=Caenorhabditis briggsae TaxID=6238 RepID=A0AAE9F7Y6_CAEBR|nr:hypothetical protein L5515_009090 [Caenorhabditis briggsae]